MLVAFFIPAAASEVESLKMMGTWVFISLYKFEKFNNKLVNMKVENYFQK